jgi:hypothetical protein
VKPKAPEGQSVRAGTSHLGLPLRPAAATKKPQAKQNPIFVLAVINLAFSPERIAILSLGTSSLLVPNFDSVLWL